MFATLAKPAERGWPPREVSPALTAIDPLRRAGEGLTRKVPTTMPRRLSRKRFLGMSAAALLGLAAAQACAPANDKPQQPRRPARAGCCQTPRPLGEDRAATPTPEPTAEPTPTPIATALPVASSIQRAPDPTASPPAPAPEQTPEAALAAQARQAYDVVIVLEGQEWGDTTNVRLANIQAAIDALARLPARVVAAISGGHPHGPLHILSNNHGRTLAGWQPYGDFPIGYYSNSDHDPKGGAARPANQVVLIPGFAHTSIGHELMHAYQFRAVPPDRYGLAMLGPEMRSFNAAVGWVQLGSDDDVREASQASSSWADFNALFEYRGRELTYRSGGASHSLGPANPFEGYATAGSFYYTRPPSIALPDWPEYWSWFRANAG